MRVPTRAVGTARTGVESEFDAKADEYESNRLGSWYKAQGRLVLDETDRVTGTVLDVGCGTGWLLRELIARHPEAAGLGVDLSERMVEVARARAVDEQAPRLEFIHGDWEAEATRRRALERLHGGASLVLCVSAFHYFERPKAALVEMRKVLAPGGRLLLMERAMDRSPATAIWDFLHRRLIRDHARFYMTSQLVDLLRDAGFTNVTIVRRVRRLLWRGKLHTSLVLLSAEVTEH